MARDLDASRAAILDVAESVFAERGFDGTSMQDIATAAGVSRGMPGYAFGSKASLYEAVMARAFARPRALMGEMAARLENEDAPTSLRAAIESYIDFLAAHPTYVGLLQRAALDGTSGMGEGTANLEALGEALVHVAQMVGSGGLRPVDPRQLVVSLLALCFFPFAHQSTLLGPLGLDAGDPAFLAERKAHIVDLVLNGLLAPTPARGQPVGVGPAGTTRARRRRRPDRRGPR